MNSNTEHSQYLQLSCISPIPVFIRLEEKKNHVPSKQNHIWSWSLSKASEVKGNTFIHFWKALGRLCLYCSCSFQKFQVVFRQKKMSVISRYVIHCELSLFPLQISFWGGIQEQYYLGKELPFSLKQSIFLMLIMWYATSHHRSQFAIYSFALNL